MKFASPSPSTAPALTKSQPHDPTLELVRFAIAQHLGATVDEVDAQHRLEDELGLDPLDLVLIALRLEELGKIEFPIAQLERATTVAHLAEMVRRWWDRSSEAITLVPPAPSTSPATGILRAELFTPRSGAHY
jgi:acyl carrier protein